MTTTIVTPDQDAIVGEIQIAAPPARVFQALTDAAQLRVWFTNPSCPIKLWQMDARLGGQYNYKTEKGTVVVNNVSEFKCHGEIIEYDPPRVLAYTWFGNWHDDTTYRTVVRWELTPTPSGTHLRVIHSGLTNLPAACTGYSQGWPGLVQALRNFAEK